MQAATEAGVSSEAAQINESSGNSGNSNGTNIRRYLVLLHDCLAIKFVPERESFHKTNNNFPNRSPTSLEGCSNCPCSPYDVGVVRSCNISSNGGGKCDGVDGSCHTATVATSLSNNPCDDAGCSKANANSANGNSYNKGRNHEWKFNNHSNRHHHYPHHQKATSNEEANDRDDHQECQFYRHQANQMGYPHDSSTQSHQPSSSLKANNDNNDREISSPTGDQVNHQLHPSIVNSNKSDHPENNNKGDYDVITHGNQSCGCSNNSHNNGAHWESGQAKQQQHHNAHNNHNRVQLKKQLQQQQPGPTHPYNYSPQAYNEHLSHNHHHQQHLGKGALLPLKDDAIYSVNNNISRSSKLRHLFEGGGGGGTNSSSSALLNKVDHSMQALFLYKEFREINLNCFWNSAVHEAFRNLEYKGSVVPSTILVGSTIRKHLTVLKTAWSRKMLRSPGGYTIDFLGEIEELIADPIAKSHFVPLSDSLCWTIHELTSSGQEAFVDDIFLSLASAFPGMALPTKELIYQTLEKLTRERKIYQTAQGYFVVTPDTHRYIMSTEPLLMQASRADYQLNATASDFLRNAILLQQATTLNAASPVPQSHHPQQQQQPQENTNEEEVTEKENLDSGRVTRDSLESPDPDTYSLPYGTFRRYNSLRVRKDASGTTGCLPRRTLSMRLPRSKKKNGNVSSHAGGGDQLTKRADVTDSFQNLDASQPVTVNEQLLSRRRKHKSFLSRLLSFRGVRKISGRKDKSGRNTSSNSNKGQTITRSDKSSSGLISFSNNGSQTCNNNENALSVTSPSPGRKMSSERQPSSSSAGNMATASTQTSFSMENLNADIALLSLSAASKNSTLEREDSDSGRCTDSHSDADAEITAALSRGLSPTIHDHHRHHHHHHLHPHVHESRRRDVVGRSHSSCNVYEKIESDLGLKVDVDECDGRSPRSPSSQMSVSPSPSTFTTASAMYNRGSNNNRHNLYSRCHSSASSSGYSYRDFYNLYRRRYPSYQQSTPTSLESAELNEALRFRPQQPIRYPPRSFERKQIFDEISRGSFKEKKHGRNKAVSIVCNNSINNADNNGKLSRAGHHPSVESILTVSPTGNTNTNNRNSDNNNCIRAGGGLNESARETSKTTATTNNATTTTTTAVTSSAPMTTILSQTLKNTTNVELEFRLPLGNIFSAAMAGGNATSSTSASSSFAATPSPKDKLSSGRSPLNESSSIHYKTEFGGERRDCTLSEVNTMVNDLFTIKSFVKTNPLNDELSSTIEFKTRGNSSGSAGSSSSNNNHNNVNNSKTTHIIEAVSSKPFADIHTKFNRESEII